MQNIKAQIQEALQKAVKEVTGIDADVVVSSPTDSSKGDYTSNVAMQLYGNQELGIRNKEYKNPLEFAEAIKEKFIIHPPAGGSKFIILDRIEAVKPGFINFWLSEEALVDHLSADALGDAYKNQKVMVEFTDPNPFKEFHIGHLFTNIIGESLARLFTANGAEVRRVNYQGDVGLHVAKALYGIMKHELGIKDHEDKTPEEKAKYLGEAYALGAKAYEEDEAAKAEINAINKKVYEKSPDIYPIYEKGREWSLAYFETLYKRLGTKFDHYYFESVAGPIGLALVKEHLKDGIFKESEGAVIFPGEAYGLHSRVFINSLGLPTYEAKELGLAPTKYKDFPYDLSVIVTGNEINAYFKVLLKALSLINEDLAKKTKHISHGMVRLPSGKMSSRSGNVITGPWLLDEAKKKISENFKDMDEQTLEMVAVGAVKYSLLKFSIGSDVTFSFDDSVSLEGNSGPYIQYTFARTRSVLQKASASGVILNSVQDLEILKQVRNDKELQPEEVLLLRTLYKFPEIIEEAVKTYSPNTVCTYLFQLAQLFNNFYQKHKILGTDENTQALRLALTDAVGHTLKTGLDLLGIKAPEKM